MRNLNKALFVLIGFIVCTEVHSQFSIKGGILAPSGDWSEAWGLGFGGQVGYKLGGEDNLSYGGSIGFFSLSGKDVDLGFLGSFSYPNISVIPILGTIEYQLNDQFYVGGDAGYNYFSIGDFEGGLTSSVGSSLAIIPKAGASFESFFAEARFNIIGDSYLSVMVGVNL